MNTKRTKSKIKNRRKIEIVDKLLISIMIISMMLIVATTCSVINLREDYKNSNINTSDNENIDTTNYSIYAGFTDVILNASKIIDTNDTQEIKLYAGLTYSISNIDESVEVAKVEENVKEISKESIEETSTEEETEEVNNNEESSEPVKEEQVQQQESEEPEETYEDEEDDNEEESSNWSSDDYERLAHLVYAEGGGQGKTCMIYIGSVVLNRVESNLFPNTIEEVINQRGQYSVKNYYMDKKISDEAYEVAEYLLTYGSQLPDYVLYQHGNGNPVRGTTTYTEVNGEVFSY